MTIEIPLSLVAPYVLLALGVVMGLVSVGAVALALYDRDDQSLKIIAVSTYGFAASGIALFVSLDMLGWVTFT